MTFAALDIPDSAADLPVWLEEQLTGLDLADVVAGIEVFQTTPAEDPSLEAVLGRSRSAVLERGLSELSDEQLLELLRHPRLLLELQECVLVEGGAYWRSKAAATGQSPLVEQAWRNVERALAGSAAVAASSAGGLPTGRRSAWMQVLSVAALVLVAVFGWWRLQHAATAPGWGWDKPGALATNVSSPEYLQQLADGANAWFNKRPQTPAALKQRLEEFRHGCDTLLAAPHAPLAEADRAWLQERCRAWRDKIDGHLASLASGAPVADVRSAADETINALVVALRGRAEKLG